MGIDFNFQRIDEKFDKQKIMNDLERAMKETVEFTKDVIVDTIETSGTDRQWVRPWYGRTGSGRARVNTGAMKNSVDTEVVKSANVVRGRVGWLENSPEYARFQELGFRHWITGQYIAGMHSLLEGAQQGTEEALRLLEKLARDK